MSETTRGVLLDLDGTLVDSVYIHVRAWSRSFRRFDHDVPDVAIHGAIGLGSDRLVAHLIGDDRQADELAEVHRQLFLDEVDALRPTRGALELLEDLERRACPFMIATSAGSDEREALLEALGRQDLPTVDADAVERSKPAPDLLVAAAEQLELPPESLTLVGDAPWDAHAARLTGMDAVGVRTGGFSTAALRDAGATRVVDTPRELVGTL
jgi:HAD superfamily hydrolase (TIGR01509 family)